MVSPEQAHGFMEHLAAAAAGAAADGFAAAIQEGVQALRAETQGDGQGRRGDNVPDPYRVQNDVGGCIEPICSEEYLQMLLQLCRLAQRRR